MGVIVVGAGVLSSWFVVMVVGPGVAAGLVVAVGSSGAADRGGYCWLGGPPPPLTFSLWLGFG